MLDADGTLTRIRGLGAKAEALAAAQTAAEGLIQARREKANAALVTAYGPWAAEFKTRERNLLLALGSRWFFLGYLADACRKWPAPSYYGGSGTTIGAAVESKAALVEPGGSGPDRAGVNTTALSGHIELAQAHHDQQLAHMLDDADFEGLTGDQRPILHNPDGSDTGLYTELTTPLSASELAGHLTFLSFEPDNVMGLSSDVLTFANEHLAAFNRTTGRPPRHTAGTDRNGPPSGDRDQPPPPPTEIPDIPIEEALPALAANLAVFDRPGIDGSPPDGRLSLDELKAAAADESLPPDLRVLAATVAANEALFAEIAALNQREDTPPTIGAGDIQTFLGTLPALEVFATQFGTFDQPSPDGVVSLDELKAAAVDSSISPQAREAARFLVDHPEALERLATYGEPPIRPHLPGELPPPTPKPLLPGEPPPRTSPDTTSFTADNARDMIDDYRQLLGLPPLPPAPPTLPLPPEAIASHSVLQGVPRL